GITAQHFPETTTALMQQPQGLPNVHPLNLNSQTLEQLDLSALSTLEPHSSSSVTLKLPTSAHPTSIQTVTPNPAIAAQPASSLTAALLPPSLHSQPAQPYLVSPTVIPISSSGTASPSLPLPPPSTVPTLPSPPSFQPSTLPISPPPPPTNTVSPDELTNAQIREQIRLETESSSPVSFPQNARMKMQAAQNQIAPQQLVDQLQQLNQEAGSSPVNPETPLSATDK
ncbi:MAG: hypothetical protein ACRDEA_03580, partial [Microcystaceae cyanobacterium]